MQLGSLAAALCAAAMLAAGSVPTAAAARGIATLPPPGGSADPAPVEGARNSSIGSVSLGAMEELASGIVAAEDLGLAVPGADVVASVDDLQMKKKKAPKKKKSKKKKSTKSGAFPPCSQGKCKPTGRSKVEGACMAGNKQRRCRLRSAGAPARSLPATLLQRTAAMLVQPWLDAAQADGAAGPGDGFDDLDGAEDSEYSYGVMN